MNLLIITHVEHKFDGNQYHAYAPYVREMNIWLKYVDKVTIIAPINKNNTINPIDIAYQHRSIHFVKVPSFHLKSLKSKLLSLLHVPYIFFIIFIHMLKAKHIHLRCPGNMGLIGSIVQILLPFKKKSAKYASNWDLNSIQPFSYKLQRKILNSTFLSKNMKVMVYGDWNHSSKNVVSLFTATYYENEKKETFPRSLSNVPIKFVFVGTLTAGKKPFYVISMIEKIIKAGFHAQLELFGEGNLSDDLKQYIHSNNLENLIHLKGNVNKETLMDVYSHSHFLILQSGSFEGWPKVVAESMFWGCVPLAIPTSVVPQMLGNGERGILLQGEIEKDTNLVIDLLKNESFYIQMSQNAMDWSRNYTLDKFEQAIYQLLHE